MGRILCCWLLLLAVGGAAAAPRELTTAAMIAAPAEQPRQVDFTNAEIVALPDNWHRTRPGEYGVVWYSVPLDAALRALAETAPLAAVVPRVAETGEFWLNGERLEISTGAGSTRNRILWLDLPPPILRAEGNALQVRVTGHPKVRNGLSAIRIGRAAELRAAYEIRRLLQTTLPLFLAFMVGIALFAAIPLWLKTRRRAHLYFIGLCAFWLPRVFLMASAATTFPTRNALLLVILLSSLAAMACIGLVGTEYLEGDERRRRRFRKALLAATALSACIAPLWLLMRPFTVQTFSMLHWPIFAVLFVLAYAHLRAALLAPRPATVFTALALIVWCATGIHDVAQIHDLTDFDSFFWAPGGVLLVFLALIWRTVEGLALTRDRADEEVRHAVTRERAAVVAEERDRLLHDLHDGMGGQLITALRMARRDEVPRAEVARIIEDSLEDMRLIIDSLDLEERDLLPLLGNLRYRLEPRLNAIGVTLRWDIEPLPDLDYLTPETGLAIVRIVQEAVNNAVRHGAAETVTVCARATPDSVELSISDNGCGFDVARAAEPGTPHRGLNAMRARALKLGGSLSIESGAGGTGVWLKLPLRRE